MYTEMKTSAIIARKVKSKESEMSKILIRDDNKRLSEMVNFLNANRLDIHHDDFKNKLTDIACLSKNIIVDYAKNDKNLSVADVNFLNEIQSAMFFLTVDILHSTSSALHSSNEYLEAFALLPAEWDFSADEYMEIFYASLPVVYTCKKSESNDFIDKHAGKKGEQKAPHLKFFDFLCRYCTDDKQIFLSYIRELNDMGECIIVYDDIDTGNESNVGRDFNELLSLDNFPFFYPFRLWIDIMCADCKIMYKENKEKDFLISELRK